MMIRNKKSFPSSTGRLKALPISQSGMTLLEVLVSMIVLAIGVLALLSTQLRSVSSIREAENETMVAQAVQNLIEGMLINPTLSSEVKKNGENSGWSKKSYATYLGLVTAGGTNRVFASPPKDATSGAATDGRDTIKTKDSIAGSQLMQFREDLAKIPSIEVYYTLCQDQSGAKPTINGKAINWHCDDHADTTMIKVLWQSDDVDNNNSASSNGALTVNGDNAVYTYQARVVD